jgi:hypothetical protein
LPRATFVPAGAMDAHPGKSVIRDWYDGTFDQHHRCAAVREAIRHLPIDDTYGSAQQDLAAYEKTVCR